MRVFKTKQLARFAKRERIGDASLAKAIYGAERGSIDADFGSGLIKKRVARSGQGKSGGYRVLVAFRASRRDVFLFGFAKNERENIDNRQRATLQEIVAYWLAADDTKLERALTDKILIEVQHDT